MIIKDFQKFSGINPLTLRDYVSHGWQNPMIIEERKNNTASIDIFSRLLQNRIIFLGDKIIPEVANIIQAQLLYLQALSVDDITIYVNSPGGFISDGLAIYDTMQFIKPDIQTVCTGMAASMASVILCAGTKGKRKILPNAKVLIHQPWGGTMGTAADMTIEVNEINKEKQRIYEILAKHTGKTAEEISLDSQRDFWLNADEALKYGCVDEIVKTTK